MRQILSVSDGLRDESTMQGVPSSQLDRSLDNSVATAVYANKVTSASFQTCLLTAYRGRVEPFGCTGNIHCSGLSHDRKSLFAPSWPISWLCRLSCDYKSINSPSLRNRCTERRIKLPVDVLSDFKRPHSTKLALLVTSRQINLELASIPDTLVFARFRWPAEQFQLLQVSNSLGYFEFRMN
jgi:hypothetical protein